jgi:hypothetical protein
MNVNEDGPANVVGSGKIAGIGVGAQGEPGMTKKAIQRYKKKNKDETPRKILGFSDFTRT